MADIRVFSQGCHEIEDFRRRVLTDDLSVEPGESDELRHRSDFDHLYKGHPEKEEIYKFSRSKWSRVGFDKIVGLVDKGKVVSISGCRQYGGQYVRVGMFYYTLRAYRKKHRSLLWREGGFFEMTQKEFPHASGYFVTIYPHNSRLKAWVGRLRSGGSFAQMAHQEPGVLDNLKRFLVMPDLIQFHGVPQMLMYAPREGSEIPEKLLREISFG